MPSSVPTRPQFYVLRAYSKIDQHLTRKELEKETYTFKGVRDKILSIGRKYK